MIKIINTNSSFGERGPFEVESIDAFVAEMSAPGNMFRNAAEEQWLSGDDEDSKYPADDGESKADYVARLVAEFADEFRDGLEIVED